MAARKQKSQDLLIFILIVSVVALVTYFLTYNAITAKITQQVTAGGF